ncbi:MAG: hypothetical protein B6A08_16245 [Sorangiineae bacterium NIC37A_2]|jgi:NADP-dependent alcohol dehydrogenase|nr:MAG: hypothetical protein B6A08_16245 [Sorangiineae bacterium NIC37A_2]
MRPFEYHVPTRLLVGSGQLEALSSLVPGGKKILCIYAGASAQASGALDAVRAALSGREYIEHFGVRANPTIEDADPITESARSFGAEFILAVGGGSVIDLAKFVAATVRAEEDSFTLLTRGKKPESPLPVGAVVTRAGTGSESNGIAAMSSARTAQKLVYIHPGTVPRFAILDPALLRSLPRPALARGIADAFVHVLEQTATYPTEDIVQQHLAEALLKSLLSVGEELIRDQVKDSTLTNFLWASSLAQGGLVSTGTPEDWATHFIGHELTALLGIEHADTLTYVLPVVYQARFEKKKERLAQLGARVFELQGEPEEVAQLTLARIVSFFRDLGLPTKLHELSLTDAQIQRIVAGLKSARRLRLGERLDLGLPEIEALLRAASRG